MLRTKLAPLSPGRFALQVTLAQSAYDKRRRAQDLLGHLVAPGDVAAVIERGLDELLDKLERQKFARFKRSCEPGVRPVTPRSRRRSTNARTIPAHVRRAVVERDGGRCTFIGTNGTRCELRTRLEFDHVLPVARGGEGTVSGVRIRCRAHNPHEVEQAFGQDSMLGKRAAAQRRLAGSSRGTAGAAVLGRDQLVMQNQATSWRIKQRHNARFR